MTILEKITFILFVGVIIFAWNKYAVTKLVKEVVRKNPNNNWLADKQNIITKGFQSFYWTFYIMLIVSFLISD
jgi:Sec-independent protein secretion pathway component TatC